MRQGLVVNVVWTGLKFTVFLPQSPRAGIEKCLTMAILGATQSKLVFYRERATLIVSANQMTDSPGLLQRRVDTGLLGAPSIWKEYDSKVSF